MRNHRARTVALVSAAALTLGLAACSGGSSPESDAGASPAADAAATADGPAAFCDAVATLDELSSAPGGVDTTNPEEAIASLEEMTETLEGLDAPAEVADAVDTVSNGFRSYTDGLSEVLADPKGEEAMTRLTEAMEGVTSQEFTEATAELEEYSQASC